MTTKRTGLGRNLSALLGQTGSSLLSDKPQTELVKLSIECLQPGKYQPRGEMEETPLLQLAESIKQQGVLQPLLVRALEPGRYEIIAGERRWRASQLAGLSEVPAVIRQVNDETAMALALLENLQREDLNAMDQARAIHRLISEFTLTHQQIADLLCKSRTTISNFLRLLSLSASIKKLLEHGDLDMGHARALLMLSEEQQNQAAQIIIAKNLSVRETEKLVERIKNGIGEKVATTASLLSHQEHLNSLTQRWNTTMKIKPGKAGKGSLVIQYKNDQVLEKIINHLLLEEELVS